MFYKINPGSKLHEALRKLQIEMQDAHGKTHEFVFKTLFKKYGIKALEYRGGRHDGLGSKFYSNTAAGGVTSFRTEGKPEGWRNSGDGFFPKNIKSNKELLEEIQSLPYVDDDAINKVIGFKKAFDDNSNKMLFTPGRRLTKAQNVPHVIAFSDWVVPKHYKPKKDMIEITKSEYDRYINRK